jgi:OOP family OmpA-OmpF porin
MQKKMIFLSTALATLAFPALAQSPLPRWYAGIAGGQAQVGTELVRNRESTLVNVDPATIHSDFDSKDTAWKVFGGFRFNQMLAVEVNYADLGSHRFTTSFVGGDPAAAGSMTIGHKISGFGADAVLSAPIGERFAVFGRVGAFRSRLEADAVLGGSVVFSNSPGDRQRSVTLNETVVKFGFGGDWWFTHNAALRLEWERYHNIGKAFAIGGTGTTGEADTDSVTLGVMMRF